MTITSERAPIDDILSDPAAMFIEPEDVLDDPTFSREEKIEILKRWAYIESQLDGFAESDDSGSQDPFITRIGEAIDFLGGSVIWNGDGDNDKDAA